MSVKKKKSKLFLAHQPVFCIECRSTCDCVSADGSRFVVRHKDDKFKPCVNDGKMWIFPQQVILAEEL